MHFRSKIVFLETNVLINFLVLQKRIIGFSLKIAAAIYFLEDTCQEVELRLNFQAITLEIF